MFKFLHWLIQKLFKQDISPQFTRPVKSKELSKIQKKKRKERAFMRLNKNKRRRAAYRGTHKYA